MREEDGAGSRHSQEVVCQKGMRRFMTKDWKGQARFEDSKGLSVKLSHQAEEREAGGVNEEERGTWGEE